MTANLTLSVVDQSPIRKGGSAADALRESVKLAQIAEGLGYSRYWVAEHHNSGSFAGTSPEVLIAQIATNTHSIRVGSGGVMLSHYSALKVAEQFRILESFFPGRIDLGIGRAPGSDRLTAAALVHPRPEADIRKFPQQVIDLISFLSGTTSEEHSFAGLRAQPGPLPDSLPEVWLLGSSFYSAQLAAVLGLPFAFADFFGTAGSHGPEAVALYRQEFQPSATLAQPRTNVTLQVICAPSEDEAQFLASSRNVNKVNQALGGSHGLLPPEEAVSYPMVQGAKIYIDHLSQGYIDGGPQQVREMIVQSAERYGTNDIGVVTNCYSFEARVRSFQLVAEAFQLNASPAPEQSMGAGPIT